MAGPMRKREWLQRLRHTALAGLRHSPWLLLALLLALLLWQAEPTALAGLFQSPPDDTPTVAPTTTPTSTAEATEGPSPTPTLTPEITTTPTVLPSDTPEVLASDTPQAPPSDTPAVAPTTFFPATATQELPPDAEGLRPEPAVEEMETPERGRERYARGETDVELDWSMLFDALSLGLSYVWLCCGGFVVVGIPLFFLALWVASTRQQRGE